LTRSALTCSQRAGAQITRFRFRRGCMQNILRRSIPFFKPEQPFHTYSIDLLILPEGLRRGCDIFFLSYDTSNMAKCEYWEHSLRQRPTRHAPRSSALVTIQIVPRLYERKCGASRGEENACGGGLRHSSTSGLRQLARAQVRRGLVHIAVPWGV
jgi:hypothetical protein